jgi:hypothetical protein
MSIWSILWSIGKFLVLLVCCAEKNLATLPAAVADIADLSAKIGATNIFQKFFFRSL